MRRALNILFIAVLFVVVLGCGTNQAISPIDKDRVTQVAIINALMLGQYDGVMPIGKLLKYGDFGLGTCDHLDGELIILDGKAYQAKADGTLSQLDLASTTPFAVVTPFEKDGSVACPAISNLADLESRLDQLLPAQEHFFAIRIDGLLDAITIRSVPRQEPPYQPLADAAKQQATWAHTKVHGTLIGIRCPKWVTGINVPGYHWHFLSEDHKIGGHVLGCAMHSGTIVYDQCDSWLIRLTDAEGKNFSQDLTRELEQVEKQRGDHEVPSPSSK